MARLNGRRRVLAREPSPPLLPHESSRLRAAANAAVRRYPGPVGEVLAHEINAWVEFGYRFGDGALMHRLADDLLRPKVPDE